MEPSLLRRYRHDRRRLLDFILSAGLAAEVRPPPGTASLSDVDLDVVSADYVLERVKTGGVLDLSEASRRYRDELEFPVMISSRSGDLFFLNTEPELSGPPPHRIPPGAETNVSYCQTSCSAEQPDKLPRREHATSRIPDVVRCTTSTAASHPTLKETSNLSFYLPTLSTELSDDDMREAAYEVLLATAFFSGEHVYFYEDKRKEKKSRFLMGLRSKRDRAKTHTQSVDWHSEILDMIRVQMEISEAMDARIKQGLMRFHSRSTPNNIDVPQIILGLLTNIYKSDFSNEKMYAQWQKRQANILEELLRGSVNLVAEDEYKIVKLSILKLRNTTEKNFTMNMNEYAETVATIRRFVLRLSHASGKFGLPGETYYWTSSYHVNVKLYEKLLFSVFDILEDGQVLEESDEFFSIFRLTWPLLGITQKMHDALYVWVLLQQHVNTGETMLLKSAVPQIRKTLSREYGSGNEEAYMNSLLCLNGTTKHNGDLSLVQAILLSVKAWCDRQLQDYHLHFSQNPENFETVVTIAVILGLHFAHSCCENKFCMDISKATMSSELLKGFVESSVCIACTRILNLLDGKTELEGKHHLAVLADDLKLTAEREFTTFTPILCRWYPEAGIASAVRLHKIYGKHLMPFLESVTDLSGNVSCVLPAADALERCLTRMFFSSGENSTSTFIHDLNPYKIGVICRPLLLQWVNAQHANLLKWTERAILIEDWEPLSSHQRQAASIVEVFRIIEENIDQFFNFKLPMDIIHLRSLLIGIFQSLDTYLLQLASKLADKKHLYPSAPALTRYKEVTNPFVKKKFIEYVALEEKIIGQLDGLTTSKLCVRLNTLHYIRDQVDTLEESIKQSWKQVHPVVDQFPEDSGEGLEHFAESIDELFTIFDEIRRTSFDVSNKICDFVGTRVIFWDMREFFLFSLYRESVEHARLEVAVQQLDSILNHICDLLIDTSRDQVILSICRASMEGYVQILLDGGPSRAFSDDDVSMVQEDLNMLKELYVASGEGLPHAAVEKEAKLAQQILDIYGLRTGTIIEMLLSASEHISVESDPMKTEKRLATNADTLLRILCHKKDREASKFLKRHYHLPKSSDYDETPVKESMSPFVSDILKRGASVQWTEKGQRSFRSMKQKFQEVAYEIKYSPWRLDSL